MPIPYATLLCRYHYDPLDRLTGCTPLAQSATQRFYLKNRLANEIQGMVQHSIMQHDDQLLAQQQRQGGAAVETALLATDQQRSVLTLLDAKRPQAFAYMPYGHCHAGGGLLSLLGFNGERPDPVTGWYLLGTGYHRPFNPVLMCFTSPDSWSPFGEGGVNAYAYCGGDPVNRLDPMGRSFVLIRAIKSVADKLRWRKPKINHHKNSLDGIYRKIDKQENLSSASILIDRQKKPTSSNIGLLSANKELNVQTDEFSSVLIEKRQQTIKTLLGQLAASQSPSEQTFLRTTINSLDKQLVHIEKKINTLNPTPLPSANRAIRKNLPKK